VLDKCYNMLNRSRRKNKYHFSRVQIIIAIGSIILIFLIVGIIKEKINRRQIDNEVANLEKQVKTSEKENLELGSLIEEWRGGSRVEKEARLKLGLKKPGEKVVMIMKETPSAPENIINKNTEIIGNIIKPKELEGAANPLKWWRYFFSKI